MNAFSIIAITALFGGAAVFGLLGLPWYYMAGYLAVFFALIVLFGVPLWALKHTITHRNTTWSGESPAWFLLNGAIIVAFTGGIAYVVSLLVGDFVFDRPSSLTTEQSFRLAALCAAYYVWLKLSERSKKRQ